jgi:hypothetical protein
MKKKLKELQELVDKYGYWSREVREFNATLDYDIMKVLNSKVKR